MLEVIKRVIKNNSWLILILFVFIQWWLPGIRVSNDLTFVSDNSLISQFDIPRLWHNRGSEGLGEFGNFILWSWPYNFLSGALANLNINFSTQTRFLFILPIVIVGYVGMRKLLFGYGLSRVPIFVSTFFFLSTTYLLLLIDGGQLAIALFYSFFPLTYFYIRKAIFKSTEDRIKALLLLALISSFDVRMLFIIALTIFIGFIFDILNNKNEIRLLITAYLKTGMILVFGWLFLNLYWLVPLIKFPIASELYSELTQNTGIQPTTWKHAFLLLQPHWYLNVFGKISPIRYEFLLIPIFAFFVPGLIILNEIFVHMSFAKFKSVVKSKNIIIFWFTMSIIGIFLSKGSNPPFGKVYEYLFTNIPVFSLFRDSSKFFLLTAFSYSILIGFSIQWLIERPIKRLKNIFSKVTLILFSIYLLILIHPVYTGKMTGMFSKPIYENLSLEVNKMIETDSQFARTLYIPSIPPLGYFSPNHPAVEAIRLLSKRPFSIGTVGAYEKLNYLREAPFMGELFSVAGIKYLYYPFPDERKVNINKDDRNYYSGFLEQLKKLPWIDKQISEPPIAVLQTKKVQERIFLTDNTFAILGSDRIYLDLMKIPEFELSNNALIFLEEIPGLINLTNLNTTILLYEKNETDLLMSFVSKEKHYFPSQYLNRDPINLQKLWKRESKDIIWWRDFLQTKYEIDNQDFDYGGGWAVSEGNNTYDISNIEYKKDDKLYVRAMTSSKGGKIIFKQGLDQIGEIETYIKDQEKIEVKLTGNETVADKIFLYDKANFNWYEVGKIYSNDLPLTFETDGDINVINAITVLKQNEINYLEKLSSSYKVLLWDDLSEVQKQALFGNNNIGGLTYKKINPTKYEIDVTDLNSQTMLILSESYNKYWQMNGQSAKPIYSFLNGFYIDESGKYYLEFSPQKYIIPCLIISITALIALLVFLIFIVLKNRYNHIQ